MYFIGIYKPCAKVCLSHLRFTDTLQIPVRQTHTQCKCHNVWHKGDYITGQILVTKQ